MAQKNTDKKSGKAAPAKKAAAVKKTAPAKKAAAAVKKAAPAKKAAVVKKAASVKKAAPAKKAAPVKKAVPAKKAAPVKKAAPAKKAAPVKKAVPAKKAAAAVKKAAPAKKAAAAVKKAVPVKKAAAAVKKSAPVKKAAVAKKAVPVKKAVPAKKAAPVKKAAPAKKETAVKKVTTVKKAAEKKSVKAVPAKKAAPAKKAEAVKKNTAAKKTQTVKKNETVKKNAAKAATVKKAAAGRTASVKNNAVKNSTAKKAVTVKKNEPAKKADMKKNENIKKAVPAKKTEPVKKNAPAKKAAPENKKETTKKITVEKKTENVKKAVEPKKNTEKKEAVSETVASKKDKKEKKNDKKNEIKLIPEPQINDEDRDPEEMAPGNFDEKLKELLNIAKKKGFAEYQEVIDTFSEFNLDEEQFDKIWDALNKNKIILRLEQIDDDDIPEEELALEEGEIDVDLDLESLENAAGDGTNIEDPVRMYLKEIGRVQLLSAEDEIDLAKKMEAGYEAYDRLKDQKKKLADVNRQLEELKGKKNTIKKTAELQKKKDDLEKKISANEAIVETGQKAGKDLSQANLRLVVSIAKRYVGRGMLFLDLIQEGNLGLIKAVEKFDYRKGYKFSTYATWWIRQAITRAIADQARTIRIPVHMVETINKIIRINRQLLQELGREPSPAEIAEKMDMPEERVREILKISQEPVSLETPIGEEEDSHLGDFIKDDNVPVPADAAAFTLLREQLDEILSTLTERERKVLTLRFGLMDGRARTLEEVGKEFNVTRERIRQIEAKALRKLRHPSRSKRIKDFLE